MGFLTAPIEATYATLAAGRQAEAFELQAEAQIAQMREQERQAIGEEQRTERQFVQKGMETMGRARAAYGASGVGLTEGSAFGQLQEQQRVMTEDVQYLRTELAAQRSAITEQIGLAEEAKEVGSEAIKLGGQAQAWGAIGSGFQSFSGLAMSFI